MLQISTRIYRLHVMPNTLKSDLRHYLIHSLTATLFIMKKILVLTDFSANSKHALAYAYNLAKQVKTNLLICNAVIEPAEMPQAGLVIWPAEESEVLFNDGSIQLDILKRHVEKEYDPAGFNPAITCIEQAGTVLAMVDSITARHDIGMIVIATHGTDGLTTLMIGNHSREMIDNTNKPLLLVPPDANVNAVKKIAFATDFADITDDLLCINKLITLAKPLNAEILIVNIFKKDGHEAEKYIHELTVKTSYPLMYYRLIKADSPYAGLTWLCDNGQIDMLTMVHRSRSLIEDIFGRSHTQKMARHTTLPLLVFPANTPSRAPIF